MSWETSRGRVTYKDGEFWLSVLDKPYLPPIHLPKNAALLCELPAEALVVGNAEVPAWEPAFPGARRR